jgi:hypothetical protein
VVCEEGYVGWHSGWRLQYGGLNHEVDGVLWLLGFGSLHSSYSSGLLDDGEVFLVIL